MRVLMQNHIDLFLPISAHLLTTWYTQWLLPFFSWKLKKIHHFIMETFNELDEWNGIYFIWVSKISILHYIIFHNNKYNKTEVHKYCVSKRALKSNGFPVKKFIQIAVVQESRSCSCIRSGSVSLQNRNNSETPTWKSIRLHHANRIQRPVVQVESWT